MNTVDALSILRELASQLPRPSFPWEERPRFEAPRPVHELAGFEDEIGFPLPPDVQQFFLETDAVVAMSMRNGYWIGGIDKLRKLRRGDDLPRESSGERSTPIATDGSGNVYLASESGHVWRWDHETGLQAQVADSFSGFLSRVAADWKAYLRDDREWRFLV